MGGFAIAETAATADITGTAPARADVLAAERTPATVDGPGTSASVQYISARKLHSLEQTVYAFA
jgi:hypothetical protein